MMLFIKGLVIGIGKIIPGVSGALLAVNFNLYEKAISSVVNFFDDWKNNLKFLIILGSGILLAIILGSKIVMYLLNNYKFITMMFFIGLISGGTYNFGVNIKYNPAVYWNFASSSRMYSSSKSFCLTSSTLKSSVLFELNSVSGFRLVSPVLKYLS